MNKNVKQLIFAVSLPCINLLLTNTMVSAKGTGLIFVSNEKGNTLSVLDSKTNQLINTIDTCGRPRGMHFNLDKTLFYVACADDNQIAVYDVATQELVERILDIEAVSYTHLTLPPICSV